MSRPTLRVALVGAAFIVLAAVPAQGQEDEVERPIGSPGFAGIPFNFAPPGARALGMGGAFIALADDATAAEANPAGLIILTQPEISFHARSADYEIETIDVDGVALFLEMQLDPERPPDSFTIRSGTPLPTLRDSVTAPSFASYVHPFRNWVLSLYYQQASRFSGSSSFAIDDDFLIDFWTTRTGVDVELTNMGISGAFRLGDLASLGLSLRHSRLDLTVLRALDVDYWWDWEFLTGDLDHIDTIRIREALDGDDSALTFNAGLLINPAGRVSFGATYKRGGRFDIPFTFLGEVCSDVPALGLTCNPATLEGNFALRVEETERRRISIPDFFGAGIAWRVTDQLILAFDAHHITYSNLQSLVGLEEDPLGITTRVPDRTELHLGAEYTILARGGTLPISLRAGVFTDPDHDGIAKEIVDSSDTHYSVGLGFVFQQNLQLDIAGRFSDSVNEGMLSLVYRF